MLRPPRLPAALLTALLVVTSTAVAALSAQTPPKKPTAPPSFVVYHVFVKGTKPRGKKVPLPRQLKVFEKEFSRATHAQVRLASAKGIRFRGDKTVPVPIPDRLGTVELQMNAAGHGRFRVRPKKGKPIAGKFSRGRPLWVGIGSIKDRSGAEYLLIVAEKKPAKKPPKRG